MGKLKIKQRQNFELALEPQSNIVCFRFQKPGITNDALNLMNSNIRKAILEKGEFYIVQTALNDLVYLRTTLMNPQTEGGDLEELLDEIERIGNGN